VLTVRKIEIAFGYSAIGVSTHQPFLAIPSPSRRSTIFTQKNTVGRGIKIKIIFTPNHDSMPFYQVTEETV
jgi:hypothetical protein